MLTTNAKSAPMPNRSAILAESIRDAIDEHRARESESRALANALMAIPGQLARVVDTLDRIASAIEARPGPSGR